MVAMGRANLTLPFYQILNSSPPLLRRFLGPLGATEYGLLYPSGAFSGQRGGRKSWNQ